MDRIIFLVHLYYNSVHCSLKYKTIVYIIQIRLKKQIEHINNIINRFCLRPTSVVTILLYYT